MTHKVLAAVEEYDRTGDPGILVERLVEIATPDGPELLNILLQVRLGQIGGNKGVLQIQNKIKERLED